MSRPARRNILLVITDQHRFDCLGAAGHPVVKTPNLDRLAGEGTLFTSAHSATTPCGPARTCIFTGLYPDQTGVHNNHIDLSPPDDKTLAEYLAEAGYDTALVGKLHLKPFHRRYGFRHFVRHDAPYTNYLADEALESAYIADTADALFGGDRETLIRRFTEDEASLTSDNLRFTLGTNIVDNPEHHEAAWVAREAIRYLDEERRKDRPFFLNLGFYGPHQPYLCPAPWDPTLYPPESIPLPPDFAYGAEDKPILQRSMARESFRAVRAQQGWTDATYREVLSAYYAYVTWIDHCLGRVLDHLRTTGLYDETVVLFTADHGDLAGQFGLLYKGHPYEGAIHVPMIARDPDAPQQGLTLADEVCSADIFPTCLRIAGVEVPGGRIRQDLRGVIRGNAGDLGPRFFQRGPYTAVYENGAKLLHCRTGDESLYEFYDLARDPLESRNLFGDPSVREACDRMQRLMDDGRVRHGGGGA